MTDADRAVAKEAFKSRTHFAWLPVKRWSGRYYQNRFYWLRWVRETWIDGEWKAMEADNA